MMVMIMKLFKRRQQEHSYWKIYVKHSASQMNQLSLTDRKAVLFIKINIMEEKEIRDLRGTHKYRRRVYGGWWRQGSSAGGEAGFSDAEIHLTLILMNKLFCSLSNS